ncbi:MAG: biosynthetic-type acetolactate synthase large subunit [Spirochaetales bacterium]|uniref:Acetolactate synthase n=1 Tax=Candidatus Thalassospirochaeta sargassi TaxID=3119039 RepID=A0AAJ1IG21_9SPIO|nr:biosynthetic-type acetolactate synthase large subunit [Spirochaetales bacterium]
MSEKDKNKMTITGADAVLEALTNEGAEIIFGYPGGATLPLYDNLEKYGLRHILCRHEQGGAHMADGYARATGKAGICMATSGPGATNLVTGIATAFMDSTPVIAISGQVPREQIGNDAFQEVDITGITIPITKHNYLVNDPDTLSESVHEAFFLSTTGRKGPVLIDIPKDVLAANLKGPDKSQKAPVLEGYNPTIKGHSGQIKKAVALLKKAEKPVIISGGGVVGSGAEDALTEFARNTDIPVVATLTGKNGYPNTDRLYLGMIGYHGTAAGNNAIQKADVIVAVGTRFGDRTTGPLRNFAPNAVIIHIDIDPAEISKNVPSFLPIVGDASHIITSIADQLGTKNDSKRNEWRDYLLKLKTDREKPADDSRLNIPLILERLKKIVPDPIITTDVGRHQIFTAHHFPVDRKNSFITSAGLGTMGFGLPAAIGAKAGMPDDTVISINGDGSFLMCCQELVTAVEENLPVIAMVMKDQRLGMISQLQDAFYGERYNCCDLGNCVDFTKIAEGMGALGIRVETPEEIDDAIKTAINSGRPTVIEFILHEQGNTYPMVTGASLTEYIEE